MRDIRKPAFMRDAESDRTHNIFLEICIAFLVFFVGSIVMSVIQAPAMMLYLLNNNDYMSMITSGDFDMNRILNAALNIPEWMMIVMLISEIILIAIVILYCRFIEKRKVHTIGFVKKGAFVKYLIGLIAGFAAFSVAYLICLVFGAVKFSGFTENVMPLYIVGYFIGYLIQGMAEEVLCRGYLFVSLSKRCHVTTAAIISALFFAGLHGINAGLSSLAFLNLFLFGIFAALLLVDTGSIWMAGAFHSLWNFAQGNFYGIRVSGNKVQSSIFASSPVENLSFINGGSFGMEGGVGVTIVLIICISIVLAHISKKNMLIDPKEQPSFAERELERLTKELEAEEMNNPWGTNIQDDQSREGQNNPANTQQNIWKDGEFNAGNSPVQNQTVVNNAKNSQMNNGQINDSQAANKQEEKVQEEENKQTSFDENYFKD